MACLVFLIYVLGVSAVKLRQGLPSREMSEDLAPCAQISRLVNLGNQTFPGSLAFDCLLSVPNRPQPAQRLVQSLKAFMNWQSTLAWLKDPPPSYEPPAVDIQGSLDNISSTVAAGGFANEYDFQLDIVKALSAAHDGHLHYVPDIFKAFWFENDLVTDLVSVSTNGTSLPKLYRLSDFEPNNGTQPVAISQINRQNATDFLLDLASQFSYSQDIDAQWNSQFITYTNLAGAGDPLAFGRIFIAPNVTLTFEDGLSKSKQTWATLQENVDFSNISTGDDFYDRFCNPAIASNSTKPDVTRRATPKNGFPIPFVQEREEGTMKGFFLNGTGFEDVAVLSLSAFEDNNNTRYLSNFQNAVQIFLNQSRTTGKQKLVIDLTKNGGGLVMAGFELFAQLFPGVNPFNANNMRLSDSLANTSQILAALPLQQQPAYARESIVLSSLLLANLSNPQGDKFSSVNDFLKPVTLQGDKFTAYFKQLLNDPSFTLTGTGNRSNPPPALFKPENVVLLTDGYCGSTCTIFSYLMLFQMNVKTVSVGGRPRSGPMQSIGGTEGSQSLSFSDISGTSTVILGAVTDPKISQQLQGSELDVLAQGYAVKRASSPDLAGINFQNAFAPYDSQTPLQFLYEAANCRFFYTPQMITSAELAWKYAVNATWTDPATYCVEGSIVPVNTSKAVDPAFQTMTNGTDANNKTNDSGGSNDGKKNAAEGALNQNSLQVVGLLVGVSIMMLYL
ncbi:hypothetical protein F4804DRAFT_352294 [Jackrogersella minutella]|nr:hypothetical protein F4804DRAFT_352294 [Jackrogersella minutella]